MTQLIENPPDFACQDLEKKKNKILVRFISWVGSPNISSPNFSSHIYGSHNFGSHTFLYK